MPETLLDNPALIRDLVKWIADCPRPYEEVMDAWRTSCPRLTVWEDTIDAGYVRVTFRQGGQGKTVEITDAGKMFLRAYEQIA